jgi:hypothetical protein
MYTQHTENIGAQTQVPAGTQAGCASKGMRPPAGRCAHTSTRVDTRTDTDTREPVHLSPAPITHTDPHLNTWAPDAGPRGRAELHAGPRTRISDTRAQPSTWTRRSTPGARSCARRTQKIPRAPRATRDRLCHPPPQSRPRHAPLQHPCCAPRSPWDPHPPWGASPTPRGRTHLFRGRPRAELRARPQEGPRKPAAHPEAARAAKLGASCSVSSFFGGGLGGERMVGEGAREAPRPGAPAGPSAGRTAVSSVRAAAAAAAAAAPPGPAPAGPGTTRAPRWGPARSWGSRRAPTCAARQPPGESGVLERRVEAAAHTRAWRE